MCGLRWTEINLDDGVLYVERNRTTAGYQVIEGDPKTAAGSRPVALDQDTVRVTADTYTSVLPHAQRRTADATAHLVLAAHRARASIRKRGRRNRPKPRPAAGTPARKAPGKADEAAGHDAANPSLVTQCDDTQVAPT